MLTARLVKVFDERAMGTTCTHGEKLRVLESKIQASVCKPSIDRGTGGASGTPRPCGACLLLTDAALRLKPTSRSMHKHLRYVQLQFALFLPPENRVIAASRRDAGARF